MTTTRCLMGRGERSENDKYVSHEIVKKMFENNEDFYDAVVRKNFDMRLLEKSFKKRRWCPRQVVGFLALGRITGYDADLVMSLLEKWVPSWRSQFWWLVFSEHAREM